MNAVTLPGRELCSCRHPLPLHPGRGPCKARGCRGGPDNGPCPAFGGSEAPEPATPPATPVNPVTVTITLTADASGAISVNGTPAAGLNGTKRQVAALLADFARLARRQRIWADIDRYVSAAQDEEPGTSRRTWES